MSTVSKRDLSGDRDGAGRFVRGNPGGPGAPLGGQAQALRAKLMATVTPARLGHVVEVLVGAALSGDIHAAKLLLSYALGPPVAHDVLERLEALEEAAQGGQDHEDV